MGNAMNRLALAVVVVLAAVVFSASPSTREANACGSFGPYDFDTYEYPNSGVGYGDLIAKAALGRLPQLNHTIAAGDLIDLRYQGLETGPRNARTSPSTANVIPPSVLKSIAWNESAWANGMTAVPWGGIGPVLRSFDCGYGIGQVTTGMANNTGVVTGRQVAIGTHPVINMMESIRILADKWNSAPQFRPIAGAGNPAYVEDWYYAIWSYNGFAFTNHPLNPNRNALRGSLFHCWSPTAPQSLVTAFNRGHYTYPELVYGCMTYPPTKGGALLWQPQLAQMPSFRPPPEPPAEPAPIDPVVAAFDIKVYDACSDAGFSGGCAGMDYPTTIPAKEVWPNTDKTPDPGSAAGILGAPVLSVSGPSSANLVANVNGNVSSVQLTVRNTGTSLAPFRIQTTAPWLVARHPGDPATRTMDGGVAAGADVPVSVAGSTQAGYDSVLNVSVNLAAYPGGDRTAILWVEPLYGSGNIFTLEVSVDYIGGPLPYRNVVPNTSR